MPPELIPASVTYSINVSHNTEIIHEIIYDSIASYNTRDRRTILMHKSGETCKVSYAFLIKIISKMLPRMQIEKVKEQQKNFLIVPPDWDLHQTPLYSD